MAETGCLKDGHFQNLQVEGEANGGNYVFNGYSRLSTFPPVSLAHSVVVGDGSKYNYGSIISVLESNNSTGYNWDNCEKLFQWLSVRDAVTDTEATELFQTEATASTTCTLAEAAAAAERTPGFDATLKIQFLTGDWNSVTNIGSTNTLFNGNDNRQNLIVFGGNTSSGSGAITLTFDTDTIDGSQSSIAYSNGRTRFPTWTITGGSGDSNDDIVITPANGTIIEKGSFIYLENTGENLVMVRGFLKISGTALQSVSIS
tara:strand:- start:426 stop:1202 length:777 start_codon:yes stop_codon:yes gene_type:complete